MDFAWCVNTVCRPHYIFSFLFVATNADVGCFRTDGDTFQEHQNALVAGKPLESWLSTVQAYETSSSLQNQVVYSYDAEGNEVPIAIIIDGNFAQQDNNMQNPLGHENEEICDQQCQWIAGQEECITNESYGEAVTNTEEITLEGEKQEIKLETEVSNIEDVVKVYNSRGAKKRTLKNLKKIQERPMSGKVNCQRKRFGRKKGNISSKLLEKKQRIRRRKRRTYDLAYRPPQSARKFTFAGSFNVKILTIQILDFCICKKQ